MAMHVFRVFARAAASVAVLLSTTALIEAADISFLTHWPPETTAKLEAAASAYSKSRPDTKITIRAVPFGDLLTTLRSSGGGAHGATIASIYDAWLPDLVKSRFVASSPEAIAAETKSNWPASVVGAASVGGALYGIPNEIDLYALNYNKRLFAEAGVAAPPKNWDELLADAKKLSDKAKGQQGFGLINSWTAGVVHPFASLLVSNGGDLIVNGKPALDSKQAKQTFELYETLIKSGYSDPAMGMADANTTGPFLDNFVSGKTGMIIMANWWEIGVEGGHGRQVPRRRDGAASGRAVGRQAAFDLLFLDDRGQRKGVGGREKGGLGFSRLAKWASVRAQRRVRDGRHPDAIVIFGHSGHRSIRSRARRRCSRPAFTACPRRARGGSSKSSPTISCPEPSGSPLQANARAAALCLAISASRSIPSGVPSMTRQRPATITRSARWAPQRTRPAIGSCAPEKRGSSSR